MGADVVGGDEGLDLSNILVACWEESAIFLVAAVRAGGLLGGSVAAGVEGVGGAIGIGLRGIGKGGSER